MVEDMVHCQLVGVYSSDFSGVGSTDFFVLNISPWQAVTISSSALSSAECGVVRIAIRKFIRIARVFHQTLVFVELQTQRGITTNTDLIADVRVAVVIVAIVAVVAARVHLLDADLVFPLTVRGQTS